MSEQIYTVNEVAESIGKLTGKTITIRGVISVRREHHGIWHWPTNEQRGNQSCLWVFFHHQTLETKEKDLDSLDGQLVLATGIVDPSRKGHLRAFPGAFTIRQLAFERANGSATTRTTK
jgi:hypothetical protein